MQTNGRESFKNAESVIAFWQYDLRMWDFKWHLHIRARILPWGCVQESGREQWWRLHFVFCQDCCKLRHMTHPNIIRSSQKWHIRYWALQESNLSEFTRNNHPSAQIICLLPWCANLELQLDVLEAFDLMSMDFNLGNQHQLHAVLRAVCQSLRTKNVLRMGPWLSTQ